MEVSKTNNRNDLIDMQRKINYNEQAIVEVMLARVRSLDKFRNDLNELCF